MKLGDLNVTKIQYVIVDSVTGDLFQDGRMFDATSHAKNAYYQDRWFPEQIHSPADLTIRTG